ncbi:TolC family protein [Puniceicoccales bacterium CK1056]|uniref:TolC family protein n=1 Tax=Oceanipulchritudo coccoides TaxID=2706888 RepID=A0A6B2M3T9_9BACT|nr:TolC family protein [Oceanipulchritudo coccoides]NDV62879.1 TolC family protein [Oceanipulchritudo coccoides]
MLSISTPVRSGIRTFLLGLITIHLLSIAIWAQSTDEGGFLYPVQDQLTLQEYMQRVVDFNESVQGRVLGFQAARSQRKAEMGQFEPAFVASGEYVDRRQPNDDIQQRTSGYAEAAVQAAFNGDPAPPRDLYPYIFEERNWRYSSAIEMTTPLGTRFRLGATGGELFNNVPSTQNSQQEGFVTSLGLTVEQPLLKGMGFAANLASLRLAARQSEIAFQEYRRELMQVVAQAELAYWELYYAQEELTLSQESVALAQTLVDDSTTSFESGRGSRLDVLEAEAGLALRKSRERSSFQRRVEAMNKLAAFFGDVPRYRQVDYTAIDEPVSQPVKTSFNNGIQTAMKMNPDFLRAKIQKEQEKIRMKYAKNQRLPELNLTASYAASGHGNDWDTSYTDVENNDFPTWTVGLVLRLPLWGDVRGRNELRASRLRMMQAERAESNLMTQLRVGRDSSEQRLKTNFMTARSLESVVEFRTNLLETRMESRDVGRMDARSVLEAEQELFVARLEQLQSEVECQRALLELQLISGSLLQVRGIETSLEDLEYQTRSLQQGTKLPSAGLVYTAPEIVRLPAEEPVSFEEDMPRAPWMGIEWQNFGTNSPSTILNNEDTQKRTPRRFDGSHIN